MKKKQCHFCELLFFDARGNRNYCSRTCYYLAKNERSKSHYKNQKTALHESTVQKNNLICEKLVAEGVQLYQSTFEELDKLGFDFGYFSHSTEHELGFAHILITFQLIPIDSFKIQIERYER